MRQWHRGSDLDLPEAKVKVGKDGEVESIKRTERLDTHRLIEEFMIAANEAVSEIMIDNKLPFIFRVHEYAEARCSITIFNKQLNLRVYRC